LGDPVVIVPLIVVAVALAFWAWMFRDLWANPDIPVDAPSGITWPPESRMARTFFFVVLNVFGALFYYFAIYRDRR
jgi:hypothetical protein